MTARDSLLGNVTWLERDPLARLLAALDGDGEEARVVGGAVRDALLGRWPGEIDLATTAVPAETVRRVEAVGGKAVPTGAEHGTITAVVGGAAYEVTTLREDIETFGRKAKVRFGRDWKLDAERRDFTMNALSLSRDGVVHDYVGGIADLRSRRVRFIGDPARRIAEDYLRILRFFRFHAAYGSGELDRDAVRACVLARDELDRLSRERVRTELLRLVTATGAAAAVAVMTDSGLLGPVIGGVALVSTFAHMTAIEAALGLEPDPMRRLGALATGIAEDAERLWKRLRLSNDEHARLAAMAEGWWRISSDMDQGDARALLYRLGPANFRNRLLIAWARSGAATSDAAWRELATLPQRWKAPSFPLRAADLIARGVAKGPRLGRALAAAEELWVKEGFPSDRAVLARIADKAARAG
jgi:poly(A) polymerase